MSSYAVAFGILGLGVSLAVLMWSIPRLRRRRKVRRFRAELVQVDLVVLAWKAWFPDGAATDDVPGAFLEPRPDRTERRRDPRDKDGDTLV